jgi:hypothetical protein
MVGEVVSRITRTALTLGGAHGIFKTSRLEQLFRDGALGPLHPPPSDFCLYNIGLHELGIDPGDVLPPMKPAQSLISKQAGSKNGSGKWLATTSSPVVLARNSVFESISPNGEPRESRWSTDHTRKKRSDHKEEAKPVALALREFCPHNAENINVETHGVGVILTIEWLDGD